jgi:hypothetical protein
LKKRLRIRRQFCPLEEEEEEEERTDYEENVRKIGKR